jgi:putative aldouronate transport system substrate-binding protein
MKKLIATSVCLITVLAMIAGCSAAPAQTNAPGVSSAPVEMQTTEKPAPVTITLMTMESDSQYNLKDTPNFKTIQGILLDKFNIDYQLETAISKDYETTITTMFAGGSKLPDMVNYAYSPDKLLNLYQNGLIIRLNDLVDQNAPDLKKLLTIRPFVSFANSDRDGNLLRIPPVYIENPQQVMNFFIVRNDWLKKVGMDSVKTPDDLYNALKAFQEQDVNGSGKKDEVMEGWGNWGFNKVLATAFGVPNMTSAIDSWYFDANGKVYNTMLTPEAKNYATFMNKLFTEGLIDQNYLNQTADNSNQKYNNNMVGATMGYWWDGVLNTQNVRSKGFTDAEYIPVSPSLAEPGRDPMIYMSDLGGFDGYMITKDCADPVAAMKIINWGYSTEGTVQNYFGEPYPGGDYYEAAKPEPGLTLSDWFMSYTEKGTKAAADDPNLWAKMGWNTEVVPMCSIGTADDVAYEFYHSFPPEQCGLGGEIQFNLNGLNTAVDNSIKAINFAPPTAEEAEQWTGYADLWTYMDEMLGKFISGTEPISNWDSFVAQCKTMGIDDATAIKQAQYDVFVKLTPGGN